MDLEAFAAPPRSQASTTGSSCGMQPRDGQTGAVDRTAPEKHRRVSSGDGWRGGEFGDSGRSEVGKDAGWGDGLSHIDGQTNQPTMVDVQVRENLNADRCLFSVHIGCEPQRPMTANCCRAQLSATAHPIALASTMPRQGLPKLLPVP